MADFARYEIVDEPVRSAAAHLAVRPLWPLLGLMLGGQWLAWPWFLFNAFAVGIRDRKRLFACLAIAVASSVAFPIAALALERAGHLPPAAAPWFGFVLVICKLAIGYVLFEQQAETADLHAYFGGRLRNGLPIVLLALFVVRPAIARALTSAESDVATVAWFALL